MTLHGSTPRPPRFHALCRLLAAAGFAVIVAALLSPALPVAQTPAETLLGREALTALDEELSGTLMKEMVSALADIHRVPASPGYHQAAELVMARARSYGLSDVHAEQFPGDGRTWFGTMRGNRGWRVESGELREVSPRPRRIASFDDLNMLVADNSESAEVTAELIDVGGGAAASDYAGKEVRGKLVLCDAGPSACHREAVERRGALGLVSYNSNQRTGWWRDDIDLIRWGHLDSRGRSNTFALMVSVRQARELQQRLASGERIVLKASVKAANDDALPYETVMATIPGTDPSLGEIVYSCHFDHQRPAANDDASGCAVNLEIARVIRTLVARGRLAPPARTLRFVFPSEMTGTIAYLAKYPELASRIRVAIHLDMVGGDPSITKSVLHVTRSPWSVASIADDVAEVFARQVIDGAYAGASSGDFSRSVRATAGSKDAFWADFTPYESGSDHWIYQEGSFGIPAIYMRDWPDIYIHTNKDVAANVEPTKLKRVAFIAAASGYYLATMPDRGAQLLRLARAGAVSHASEDARTVAAWVGAGRVDQAEGARLVGAIVERERARLRGASRLVEGRLSDPRTLAGFEAAAEDMRTIGTALGFASTGAAPAGPDRQAARSATPAAAADAAAARIPVRNPAVKGPLPPTSEWVIERAGAEAAALAINARDDAGDLTYEILNLVNGRRTVGEIRTIVSAEFEPVELAVVAAYLELLEKIGAVSFK